MVPGFALGPKFLSHGGAKGISFLSHIGNLFRIYIYIYGIYIYIYCVCVCVWLICSLLHVLSENEVRNWTRK